MARNRFNSNLGDLSGNLAADQSVPNSVLGTTDADVLVGRGSDIIDGLGGADTITVQNNDSVYLYGSEASITATGGAPTLLLQSISAGFAIDLSNTADQSSGDAAVVTGFTNVDASEIPWWVSGVAITGDDQGNRIVGSDANDTLTGGGGNDTITGGAGFDSVYGGDGDDFVQLGFNVDWVWGAAVMIPSPGPTENCFGAVTATTSCSRMMCSPSVGSTISTAAMASIRPTSVP